MMTISESQYSSNKRSSIHTINDRVVHRDSYDDVNSSSSVNSALVTKRGFKPSDMFDPQKKEFLTNLSYKLFPNEADTSHGTLDVHEEAVKQSSELAYSVEEVSGTSNISVTQQLESTTLEELSETRNLSVLQQLQSTSGVEAVPEAGEEQFQNDGEYSGVRDEAIMQPPGFAPEDLENKPLIVGEKEIDLNKIFTPAPDAEEHIIKKDRKFEKTFASSAFYVPGVHPTVKEQMDLARSISKSLSDSSNHMSRGQSMYVNRKKRSVKWVHEGRGRNTSNSCSTPSPVANHDTAYRPPSSLRNQKTYPKSVLKHSPNNFPKIEPFPVITAPTISLQNLDIPVPLAPTKLNDVYASPKSSRLPLVCGPNFNVAPRGWGEMKDYYRPVPLDLGSKGYSDF